MQQPNKNKKRPDTPLAETPKITYDRLGLARTAANNAAGRDTDAPATARDSANYRAGFRAGLRGVKPSDLRKKYEGEEQYFQKGRWEGLNAAKKKATKKK